MDLFDLLKLDDDLETIIDDRLYKVFPQQDVAFPFVTITIDATEIETDLDGDSSIYREGYSVEVYGQTEASVSAIGTILQTYNAFKSPPFLGIFLSSYSEEREEPYYHALANFLVVRE
jgi:hypothetical protein